MNVAFPKIISAGSVQTWQTWAIQKSDGAYLHRSDTYWTFNLNTAHWFDSAARAESFWTSLALTGDMQKLESANSGYFA